MQVAAHEARLGHGKLAVELRALVDEAKNGRPPRPLDNVSTDRPHGGSSGLLETPYPRARLREMILSNPVAQQIERVIREQRHAGRIIEQGLVPGASSSWLDRRGTGKTMTASVLVGELGLALLQVRLDGSSPSTWARPRHGSDRCSTPQAACETCTSSTSSTPSARSAASPTTCARQR